MAYKVDKLIASSSKSAISQKNKKKSCKVVERRGARGGVSLRASASTSNNLVMTGGNALTIYPK